MATRALRWSPTRPTSSPGATARPRFCLQPRTQLTTGGPWKVLLRAQWLNRWDHRSIHYAWLFCNPSLLLCKTGTTTRLTSGRSGASWRNCSPAVCSSNTTPSRPPLHFCPPLVCTHVSTTALSDFPAPLRFRHFQLPVRWSHQITLMCVALAPIRLRRLVCCHRHCLRASLQ